PSCSELHSWRPWGRGRALEVSPVADRCLRLSEVHQACPSRSGGAASVAAEPAPGQRPAPAGPGKARQRPRKIKIGKDDERNGEESAWSAWNLSRARRQI